MKSDAEASISSIYCQTSRIIWCTSSTIDHKEEVQKVLEILDKCSSGTFAILHNRHAAAQAIAAPAQIAAAARAAPKPSASELKPEKFTHDTSM